MQYHLRKNGIHKQYLAHRLVAKAFIPNPLNKREVNHKDENIKNNNVDNLEWVTSKENANYGTRNERCAKANEKFCKGVVQYTLEGKYVTEYKSIREAAKKYNVRSENIMRVCQGKRTTSCGYKWKYKSQAC